MVTGHSEILFPGLVSKQKSKVAKNRETERQTETTKSWRWRQVWQRRCSSWRGPVWPWWWCQCWWCVRGEQQQSWVCFNRSWQRNWVEHQASARNILHGVSHKTIQARYHRYGKYDFHWLLFRNKSTLPPSSNNVPPSPAFYGPLIPPFIRRYFEVN